MVSIVLIVYKKVLSIEHVRVSSALQGFGWSIAVLFSEVGDRIFIGSIINTTPIENLT